MAHILRHDLVLLQLTQEDIPKQNKHNKTFNNLGKYTSKTNFRCVEIGALAVQKNRDLPNKWPPLKIQQ